MFYPLSLVLFCATGTESERSSVAPYSGRESQRRLLRQPHSSLGPQSGGPAFPLAAQPGTKPMKMAVINGKPKRYLGLSRECEFVFILLFEIDIIWIMIIYISLIFTPD